MKILFRTAALAAVICTFAAQGADSGASYSKPVLWRDYHGATWGPDTPADVSLNAPITGVHFDKAGRAFASTPRFITTALPATLNLLDTAQASGSAHLTAFPSGSENDASGDPATHLRSVLGFYVDQRNGWVWVLDMGFVAGESEAPAGAQKLVVYESATGKLVKRVALDAVADRKGSYLNDVAVDEKRKVAFISDSGVRGGDPGIIVVDLQSGHVRRALDKDTHVSPEPGVTLVAHGYDVLPGNPLKVGINGIALSADGKTLYWAVTTGRHAYALAADLLRDEHASDVALSAAVIDLGDVGGNTDGILADASGHVYLTDLTRNGIVEYRPGSSMTLLASDVALHWPDTISMTPDGDLLFTTSALNEHFMGLVKPGEERYQLWRMKKTIRRPTTQSGH
ncbi:major royal jelly family protein [Luteibacter aegosomatissinici]|uniref:major royal jelly family protein n=1 Tax=Luteibacter aegosomatissinici TaxID=2911539 RepID=UPI001FFAF07E|nr:major royal jelly family protein [Luteibacter aegosomatissinici]UPG94541.1 major royal jelly family protein [Luteibacter aegosomatissinici]